MKRSLFAFACAALFAILGVAAVLAWYLLWTTDGARLVLRTAASALQGTASIDLRIKSGSLAHGFDSDGPFRVEVPGTVEVSGDSLAIRYSLAGYLVSGTLEVERLEAPSLVVRLEPSPADDAAAQDPSLSGQGDPASASSEPFRVDIPVTAVVRRLISSDFAYRSDIVDVTAKKVDLTLSCGGDYAGVLSGDLEDVGVHLKDTGGGDSEPMPKVKTFGGEGIAPFETIDLPLDAEIRNLRLRRARYWMDGFDTGVFDGYVDAGWKGHLLKVRRIGISHAWGHAGLSGSMDFSRYFGMDFKLGYRGAEDADARERFAGALAGLAGSAEITGDLTDLRASADNQEPMKARASARINALSGLFPIEADASSPAAVWPLWMPADLAGTMPGAPKAEKADGEGIGGGILEDLAGAEGQAEKAGGKAAKSASSSAKSPAGGDGDEDGSAEADGGSSAAARLADPSFAYGVRADGARASLRGFIAGRLEASASATVSGYGLKDVKAEARGALEDFFPVLQSFKADGSYMGSHFKAALEGDASPGEGVFFSGRAEASSDDPQKAFPFLKGRTWASADAAARLDENGEPELELSGLKGAAALEKISPSFSAKSLRLGSEGVGADDLKVDDKAFSIRVSGLAGSESDLSGKFEIKDLSRLLSGASGSVSGSLALAGDLENPEGRVAATSKKLTLGTHEFSGVTLSATADAGRGAGSLTLLSETVRIAPGLSPSKKCALDVNGTLESHSAVLSCAGRNGGFLSLDGGLDPKTLKWSGRVSDFIVESEFADTITLGQAVPLALNLRTLEGSIGAASLRGSGALDFSEARFSPKSLKFSAAIRQLSLAPLKKVLPAKWDLSGTADGSLNLSGSPAAPRLDASIGITRGRIAGPEVAFAFDRFKLGASGGGKGITVDLDAAVRHKGGTILSSITISDPRGAKRLSGSLKVDGLALSRLRHLGGGFNELDGTARADLKIGGTLARPLLYGSAGASGSAEPRYDIGRIDSFSFNLDANGQGGMLRGSVGMNQGRLSISGPLDWADGAHGKISITSRALPVLLVGYGECRADIDATATLGESSSLKGRVFIPSADVRISSIGDSGTAPSPDEVIVGSGGAQELIEERRAAAAKAKAKAEGTAMDLTVTLGSRVRISAMGLKAGAEGEVRLVKEPSDSEPKARGQVSLVDGHADIYGHRFVVSYAESDFDGKIANPKIRAEVIADPSSMEDDVVAGVRVKGTASDPSIILFSKPAMSQNEILSYLLYGHGLEKTPENPESSSSQLLLALGLGTTSGLMNSISDAFGMRNLQFGSSGSGESTQVGVQGYLTNRIMISYGYGVFTSVGEFRLRYELMRKLYAEFVSSVDQAVDLIYSFDFN
jgi:translocation and assembly module TamB